MMKDLMDLESDEFWRWWYTKGRNDNSVTGMSYVDGKNYSRSFRKRF